MSFTVNNPVINQYKTPSESDHFKGDPLNDAQKERIKAFVDKHLLTSETVKDTSWGYERIRPQNIFEVDGKLIHHAQFKALYKTYDSFDPKGLGLAKEVMGSEAFQTFRAAVKNPATQAESFGIDPHKTDQVFAAQVFMKQEIKIIQRQDSFDDVHGKYRDKMASNKSNRMDHHNECSAKTKLLMLGDPLQKLDQSKPHTPFDVILANTHFVAPKEEQTIRQNGIVVEVQEFGPTREDARKTIVAEFRNLAQNPELTHVIDALGTLIQVEKGNILFTGTPFGTGKFGEPYGNYANCLGGSEGFYNDKHTVISCAIINPFDCKVSRARLRTFVHESLHFLFNRIVNFGSSPTIDGSIEEKQLDEALAKDRAHRKGLSKDKLSSPQQQSVFRTLVTNLEEQKDYFQGYSFDPNFAAHLTVMRCESIVRVMEQIASGATRSDIEAVAPSLCKFYYEVSKPMLEKYAADHAHIFK